MKIYARSESGFIERHIATLAGAGFLLCLLSSVFVPSTEAATDYCAYETKAIKFLIDQTTAFDDLDIDNLKDGTRQLLNSLGPGDRLIIETITDAAVHGKPLFDACIPFCPESYFSSCNRTLAKVDRRTFIKDVGVIVTAVIKDLQSYPYSDVLGSILQEPIGRMVIFSDGLHRTADFQLTPPNFSSHADSCADIAGKYDAPDLDGADITFFGAGRYHDNARRPLTPAELQELRQFWQVCLSSVGSRSVSVVYRLGRHMANK